MPRGIRFRITGESARRRANRNVPVFDTPAAMLPCCVATQPGDNLRQSLFFALLPDGLHGVE